MRKRGGAWAVQEVHHAYACLPVLLHGTLPLSASACTSTSPLSRFHHPLPKGAISAVIPWSTEPRDGGLAVHTIVLFGGGCEAGKAGSRALHVKLLGDVRPLFYVPVPRAKSLFGDVSMVTVGFPYLVSRMRPPAAATAGRAWWRCSVSWSSTLPVCCTCVVHLLTCAFRLSHCSWPAGLPHPSPGSERRCS